MWIPLAAVILDRVTKAAAMGPGLRFSLIPGIINIRYVENTGVAFSMFSGGGWGLILVTFLLVAGLTAWQLAKPDENPVFRAGMWLIIGGGLGNLYDRIAYGYVIDFIETAFMRFPVFNVADICVCVGAAIVILGVFLEEMKERGRDRC